MLRSRREVLCSTVAALAAAGLPGLAPAAASGAQRHRIEIEGFAFNPGELTLNAGDTIVWVNKDIAPHTATAADGSWDTGTLRRGEEAAVVITEPGRVEYVCRFHPMMKAHLIVKARTGEGD